MIQAPESKKRFEAAYKLLLEDTTSRDKFEAIRVLIAGFSPQIDSKLAGLSQAISDCLSLQSGDVITLAAERLPESTEEEKKRKKAVVYLIHLWHDLTSEVLRIKHEFEQDNNSHETTQEKVAHFGKAVSFAKGPFGLVTIVALFVVGGYFLVTGHTTGQKQVLNARVTPNKAKIKVIIFNGEKLPLQSLYIGHGPDCGNGVPTPHYHALNEVAQALDGTMVPDPGGCGYGKVADLQVVEVDQ